MAQEIRAAEVPPLSNPERAQFDRLCADLRAADGIESVNFLIAAEDADGPRRGVIVRHKRLSAGDLCRISDLSERMTAPLGIECAKIAARRLMAGFAADRFTDPKIFVGLVVEMLEGAPAVAALAMVDPKNPKSLIRTAKFMPTLSEISAWVDEFMRALLPSAKVVSDLIKGVETFERLRKIPGFKIETGA